MRMDSYRRNPFGDDYMLNAYARMRYRSNALAESASREDVRQ